MNTESQVEPHKCANPQCKVSESGRCLEGLTFDKCPTYGRDQAVEQLAENDVVVEPTKNLTQLRPAVSLQLSRASELLGHQDGRVIAIIGPRDAGKTSLIASLFELFQGGPVEGVSFAGSETLHAFELACHDSRAASRRATPNQERTGHGEVRFYHLNVVNGSGAAGLTLLLGDRAGEEYRTAADDLTQAGPFPEIVRADTVTVLVDGGRLLDNKTRHNTCNETGLMIRAMVDGGFLKRAPQVIFALTKLDLVRASELKDRALADFNKVVEHASPIVSPHAQSIEAVHIAAAPADTSMDRGTGVCTLLQFWVQPILRPDFPIAAPAPANRAILNLRIPSIDEQGVT